MSTDKELLELAAKAAGIDFSWRGGVPTRFDGKDFIVWNPIDHDGDALRLAVKLDINVHTKNDCVYQNDVIWFYNPDDIYAATRRAIVRAAAEIGEEMK